MLHAYCRQGWTFEISFKTKGAEMRIFILMGLLSFCMGLSACSEHPSYVVCRGEAYCTTALTHEEAIQAAQLKKAWADEGLYVRPGR